MKNKDSNIPPTASKRITSWDDVVFDPAQFVKDMEELADHYEGKKKLTLRTFRVTRPAPKFTSTDIVRLREASNLSRPLFAQILNVPTITVRKWEAGERSPSGAALRLLEVMKTKPEVLLDLGQSSFKSTL